MPEYKLKRLDRKLVCRGKILNMYRDRMLLPDGSTDDWDFISHKSGGGACTVPVLPDGRILLVRQFRPSMGRETLELPAGANNRLPDGAIEDPALTAKRELEEETGYSCNQLQPLLTLRSAVAYCDEVIHVFLAENVRKIKEQQLDAAEEIEVEILPLAALLDLIYEGKIQDAKTAAGILAFAARK